MYHYSCKDASYLMLQNAKWSSYSEIHIEKITNPQKNCTRY